MHRISSYSLVLWTCLLAAYCGWAPLARSEEGGVNKGESSKPEFLGYFCDCRRLVALQRGGQWLMGTVDCDGEFVSDARLAPLRNGPARLVLGLFVPTINRPVVPNESVYELRGHWDLLVKGTLTVEGRFVPEVASKVLTFGSYYDLRTYRPGKTPRIYNLPGQMYVNEAEHDKRDEELGRLSPAFSEQKGAEDLEDRGPLVFWPQDNRRVEIMRDEVLLRGMLDARGNFIRDRRFGPRGEDFPSVQPGGGLQIDQIVPGEPRFVPRINSANGPFLFGTPEEEAVYELRGDCLLPGKLCKDGRFIPEVGGKVTKFERVRNERYPNRIYNLPGRFVLIQW